VVPGFPPESAQGQFACDAWRRQSEPNANAGYNIMKAISVKQPWANMIAEGEKTIETRTWATDYRGNILIVSAKQPNIAPAGYALAIATLEDCRPMSVLDEPAAKSRKVPGAIAWVLGNIRKLKKPFPVQGQLKLFEVDVSGMESFDGAVVADEKEAR
jgi:hypothetical protein